MRSYQCDDGDGVSGGGAWADAGCGAKALGANSAVGSSVGPPGGGRDGGAPPRAGELEEGEPGAAGGGRWMLAVGGGGRFVRLGLRVAAALPRPGSPSPRPCCALGLAPSPPYFSMSSSVESYFVASLSFWIVLARSVWCSLRRAATLSMRKEKYAEVRVRTRYILPAKGTLISQTFPGRFQTSVLRLNGSLKGLGPRRLRLRRLLTPARTTIMLATSC